MSGNENSSDGLWMLFFVFAIVIGISLALWFLFKPQLLQGYLWLRQGEIAVASLWTSDDREFEVIANGRPSTITFGQVRGMLDRLTPQDLTSDRMEILEVVKATTEATLKPFKIPFGIMIAFMIYYAMLKGPTSHHRKIYNLDGLIKIQSTIFKIINPIVAFDPAKKTHRSPGSPVPAILPLFAEALSPEEWIAFHKIPIVDDKADREEMEKAFREQLLEPWKGAQKAPPYAQILLAAFALKTVRKRADSDDMLGRLALCWDHKSGLKLSKDSGLLSKARKVLKDKNIAAATLKECNRHAYLTTALLGALELARREGGVLAPAQFLWLRGYNRTLWYPLNNLGRQAYHAEAMGAMSHYRAEKQIERPIPKPMMRDAIQAMEGYVDKIRQNKTPIPPVDYSMIKNEKAPNKNKGVLKPAGT